MGLELVLKEVGIALVRAAVGDRYVVEEMLKGGYNLGGEQSGHLVFLDHNTTGDGMITALRVLAIMQKRMKPLADLAAVMRTFPQTLRSVKVKAKRDFTHMSSIQQLIEAFQAELGGRGRLLVRYSGTEPVLRIMIEGEDEQRISAMADALVGAAERTLG
jgi:phosphoglucosamine mutase